MTPQLKLFIETNIDLIETERYRELYLKAYNYKLTDNDIIVLYNALLNAGIDTYSSRETLLQKLIDMHINALRMLGANTCIKLIVILDSMNNWMGFTYADAIQYVIDNQKRLNVDVEFSNNQYFITVL